MAFFGNLGSKIAQTGQNAAQKAKKLTEIAGLNGTVNEEEKKIHALYSQIGKLYATLHHEEYEAEFEEMMIALKESENKIAECRERIQDLKGFLKCEKCGATVPGTAAFCNACGNPMPKKQAEAAEPSGIKCPQCSVIVQKGMRFCTSCGASLEEGAVETSEPTKLCPNCGVALEDDAAFCTECGTRL